VTAGGDRHDARPVGHGEGRVQSGGECEVAKVVDAELGLPARCRQGLIFEKTAACPAGDP
jgi:hypothetical protein